MQRVTKLKRKRQIDWSPQKVAEYSSIMNAQNTNFIANSKILLSLSAGGIGLLVAISNSFSFWSIYQITAFACSVFLFYVTIFSIMAIRVCKLELLDVSKEELLVSNSDKKDIFIKKRNKARKNKDFYAGLGAATFMLALLCMAIFSGISIYEKYSSKKESKLSNSYKVEKCN